MAKEVKLTESDIITAVKQRETELQPLRERFENDYGLWRLTPYSLDKKIGTISEYENYTTNEPKTLANRVIEILSASPLLIRIPLELDSEEKRKRKSATERLIYGAMNLANFRLQMLMMPPVQSQLASYSTFRGWYGMRVFFRKDEHGEVISDIKVYDPLHLTWDIGEDGLSWQNHERTISKLQAKSEYKIETGSKGVKIYDFWNKNVNAIIAGDKFVKKPTEHELGHIPCLISFVGSMPFIQSEKFQDTIVDMGESIYTSNRGIYDSKNKQVTLLQTIVGLGAHNPLAVYSAGGRKPFEKSPYYKGAIIQLDTDKNERVEPLLKPEMPRDVGNLLNIVTKDLSMGGMPPIAGGELNFQLPYSAVNLLMDAARSVILPRQAAMERSLEWMAREILTQYSKGGFGKLRLHGRDGSNQYFDVELTSEDVQGDWFPEVKILPSLPEDEPRNVEMVRILNQEKMLSKETMQDRFLGVRDTDIENQKLDREDAYDMPNIRHRRMAAALMVEGRPDMAAFHLAAAQNMEAQMAQQYAGSTTRKTTSNLPVGMSETVLPEEQLGVRQTPPETQVGGA